MESSKLQQVEFQMFDNGKLLKSELITCSAVCEYWYKSKNNVELRNIIEIKMNNNKTDYLETEFRLMPNVQKTIYLKRDRIFRFTINVNVTTCVDLKVVIYLMVEVYNKT
jgi:hypothetical protein